MQVAHEQSHKEPMRMAVLALLLSVFAAIGFPIFQQGYPRSPGIPELMPWLLSLLAIGLALVASSRSDAVGTRVTAGIASLAGASLNVAAILSRTLSHNEDPLPWLLILTASMGVGWFCGQRMVSGISVSVVGVAICAALLPGRREANVEHGNLRATLTALGKSAGRSGFSLTLRSTNGLDITQTVDARFIEIHAKNGSLLPLPDNIILHEPLAGNEQPFAAATQIEAPSWSRNANVTVAVQLRPPTAAVTLNLPLDHPPKQAHGSGKGLVLDLDHIKWGTSGVFRGATSLNMDVKSNLGDFGATALFVQDDLGNVIEVGSGGNYYVGDERRYRWELVGIGRGAKTVTISCYTQAQLRANRQEFRFTRMATR